MDETVRTAGAASHSATGLPPPALPSRAARIAEKLGV